MIKGDYHLTVSEQTVPPSVRQWIYYQLKFGEDFIHGSRAISLRRSIVVNRNKQVGNFERTENLDPSKKLSSQMSTTIVTKL